MNIKLNDKTVEMADGATLADLLAVTGVADKGVATALNGTVIAVSERESTPLADGDTVLVIRPFYGG